MKTAFGTYDYLPIGGIPFQKGEYVSLVTLYCAGSNHQDHKYVTSYPNPKLPKINAVEATLMPGAASFLASNVVTGARMTVELTRQGGVTRWTEDCGFSPCGVYLPSPLARLEPSDHIEMWQELCDGTSSTIAEVDVPSCDSAVPPEVEVLPRFGDTFTTVKNMPLGGTNVVLVTDSLDSRVGLVVLGFAQNAAVVGFVRPLDVPDVWMVVAQPNAVCVNPVGSDFSVVP